MIEKHVFLRQYDPKTISSIKNDNINVPFGCKAIIYSRGSVQKIKLEGTPLEDKMNFWETLTSRVSDAVRSLLGRGQEVEKIYIVLDLECLPAASMQKTIKWRELGDEKLKFNFWLGNDSTSLARFIEKYSDKLIGKPLSSFVELASAELNSFLEIYSNPNNPASRDWAEQVSRDFENFSGISSSVSFEKLEFSERKQITLTSGSSHFKCSNCGEAYTKRIKFCEACGSDAVIPHSNPSSQLIDSDGNFLSLIISYNDYSAETSQNLASSRLEEFLLQVIAPKMKSFHLNEFRDIETIAAIEVELNNTVSKEFDYLADDFQIVDVRSEDADWIFNTNKIIENQKRDISYLIDNLQVGEARKEYERAAFDLAISRRNQSLKQDLELQILENEMKVQTYESEDKSKAKIEDIDVEAEIRHLQNQNRIVDTASKLRQQEIIQQLDFEKDKLAKNKEIEALKAETDNKINHLRNKGEIDQALDQKYSELDFNKAVSQARLDEEKAKRELDQQDLDRANDREAERLRLLAELEANINKQEQSFEAERISQLKGLSAQEILALQAAVLSGKARAEDIPELIKNISNLENDSELSALKEQMYEKLLEEKEKSQNALSQAQNEALSVIKQTNDTLSAAVTSAADSRLEGYKEAAQSAKSTNEKAMDSMAKVASSAATKKEIREKNLLACKNSSCSYKFEDKVSKFCPVCGEAQRS